MAVIIVVLFWFFPEIKSSLTCVSRAGSYNFPNRVCKNVSEDFCKNKLKGEFLGCDTECKDEYSIKTCEAKCFGSCKTEAFNERFK